jgi:hypothetical protein
MMKLFNEQKEVILAMAWEFSRAPEGHRANEWLNDASGKLESYQAQAKEMLETCKEAQEAVSTLRTPGCLQVLMGLVQNAAGYEAEASERSRSGGGTQSRLHSSSAKSLGHDIYDFHSILRTW